MNLLLDTHIWIWSKLDPRRLGARTKSELSSDTNELWLSPVSVWEALVLMKKGRVQVDNPSLWIEQAAELLREAPLTHEIVRTGLELPLRHRDPVDCFLAGTAKTLNLTLVTADRKLLELREIATLPNS